MAITEQHSSRRNKHSHVEQNTYSIDRLSDLPDAVLCHILSRLRTIESIRTSILGKRWRFLWAYVPTLDFDSEEAYFDDNLINRVLLLRQVQTVNTFRLYDFSCDTYQLETWVTFAIMRGVQKLDLCLQYQRGVTPLPGCLFSCKTLVDLRLENCGVIPVTDAVCLPRLKILHLLFVHYEADESLPHLLSGCPVLEELKIKLDKDMVHMDVSSPTIKSLMLEFIFEGCGGRSDRLEMNTPALEYLQIINCCCDHIKVGVLTSLNKAEINFYNDEEKEDYYLCSRAALEFIHSLCNVKCLKLDFSSCAEFVCSVFSAWTMSFRNLTELELTADCLLLSKFLAKADNLEILIFSECWEDIEGWMERRPQQVPRCLLSHLRFIKLVYIKGTKHELVMIKYLLRNAKVLERMEITYPKFLDSGKTIDMLKNISHFQRRSRACKVDFVQFP